MSYMIDGEKPTGAMIALVPADPGELALPGGEDPRALHVTVKFLGKADDWDDERRSHLLESVKSIADTTDPVQLDCAGCEMFGEEHDALAVQFESPVAHALHKLCHGLTPEVELTWPDYKPHMTLAYVRDEGGPSVEDVSGNLHGKTVTCDRLRVAFGEDVHDFVLGRKNFEAMTEEMLDIAAAVIVAAPPPSKQPKRAQPNQLTDAEIEQRRQAALKSAEARRKKGGQALKQKTAGKDAITRANMEFWVRSVNENRIRDYKKALTNPRLSREQRAMLQTALEIELANKRELRMQKLSETRRVKNELASKRAELARAERVFDVEAIKRLQKEVGALEKEAESMEFSEELVSEHFRIKHDAEREHARAAAERRREEARQKAEIKRQTRERESARKKAESERKKAERERWKRLGDVERMTKKAESEKKKKAKKKKEEPRSYLSAERRRELAGK